MYEEGGDWYVHKQGHPKFSPKNLENTWFKTTWYTGLPVRHSLQNPIVVCTNEKACSLNSVIAALSNMGCHWLNLKQFGLAFNNVLRRELVVSLYSQSHILPSLTSNELNSQVQEAVNGVTLLEFRRLNSGAKWKWRKSQILQFCTNFCW